MAKETPSHEDIQTQTLPEGNLMEMIFTVVDLNGKEYTTAPLADWDNWEQAIKGAILYAHKFWRAGCGPVKIKSIQQTDI